MSLTYEDFLATKRKAAPSSGKEPGPIHESLYPFQRAIVEWAIRKGRAAVFADCGLGKTRIQLEWARQMGERVLIVAPLCVAEQTIAEAHAIGIEDIGYVKQPNGHRIDVTNYQRLHRFAGAPYDAIVLDESSILKSLDGKTRGMLLRDFTAIPHRLCCTATPAPNDLAEIANHSQFLGIMSRAEMLATFFVHEAQNSQGWRIKGHAQDAFWKWMVGWSLFLRDPSDVGFDDERFKLPKLRTIEHFVQATYVPEGFLFPLGVGGITGRREARRRTIGERVAMVSKMIEDTPGHWLVWHDLNDEGHAMHESLNGSSVLVEGADDEEARLDKNAAWKSGDRRVLITKPSIFGHGMNWQHCSNVAFLGLSDSYERYYQAVRRCWRFGQRKPVNVHVVVSDAEGDVLRNVKQKEAVAMAMAEDVIRHLGDLEAAVLHGVQKSEEPYRTGETTGNGWTMVLGDSCEKMRDIPEASVGLSVFSPPFASLYTYTASERDLGNSSSYDEFFVHFGYIIRELLRVTMPCRRSCVHVQQVPTLKGTHGVIGWRDLRADTVRAFVAAGWIYDGEIVIDKDPQAQAIRTKSKALMFVQKNKDSAWSRPAMADYILLFRSPGENAQPIETDVTNEEWISWARPIWYGIRETETLNVAQARSEKDERHICPLQLETIRRIVRLWSNRGDLVLSPFAGIGSEGYESVRLGRRFHGIELKPEYYQCAIRNLGVADREQAPLFAEASADGE